MSQMSLSQSLFPPGAQGFLRVTLLLGTDSSLPAAFGTLQTQDFPAGSGTQGGPKAWSAHIHQKLPAAGMQRLCPLKALYAVVS